MPYTRSNPSSLGSSAPLGVVGGGGLSATLSESVLVSGTAVPALTKTSSAARCGLHVPAHLDYFAATADPREFTFSPRSFVPATGVAIPIPGDVIIRDGQGYRIGNVDKIFLGGDVQSINVFAYRVLMSTDASLSPVLPTETVQLWRTGTIRGAANPATLNTVDVGDTRQPDTLALFVPLSIAEKMAAFGVLDLRVNAVYTNQYLLQNDVLYRPAVAEAWVVLTPSEMQPGAGLISTHVKHLQVTPVQIRQSN